MKQRRTATSTRQSHPIRKRKSTELLNIELDTKCSCTSPEMQDDASIQFARRYLQCPSSMPIAALRRFIQTTLSLSPKIQVSIFDGNNRLLKDSHRLSSLRHTASSASFDHIPLRLELINPHTSIGHCRCSNTLNDSSLSELITSDCIDQILSTIPLTFVRSSLSPTSSSRDSGLSESMLDDITSNFGEIFPANSCRLVAETSEVFVYQMMPLDLSMHDE